MSQEGYSGWINSLGSKNGEGTSMGCFFVFLCFLFFCFFFFFAFVFNNGVRSWCVQLPNDWELLDNLLRRSMLLFGDITHYIYYCGQEPLRRNGVAILVNKIVWNAVLGCSLKKDRMISVLFQGKSFNIMVIQIYAPTRNAEEAEV